LPQNLGQLGEQEFEDGSSKRRSAMNIYRHKIRNIGRVAPILVIGVLFFLALGYETAHGQTFQISVPMSGAEEVPPVATPATGLGNLSVNTATGAISGTVSFSGLSSPATAGHIHLGAAGLNGAVIIPLIGGVGVTAGTMILPGAVLLPDQLAALTSNGLYINIHTSINLNGEIRGQILFTTATQVGSVNDQVLLVDVVSGDFNPARAGDELAGLSEDGRVFISMDLATWIELPGTFTRLIKGDFNGDGVDDLGGLSAAGGTVMLTTDFGASFTELPFPVE